MKTLLKTSIRACVILTLAAVIGSAQLADKKALTLVAAKQIVAAAEDEAAKNKWTMVFAILDDGGNLVLLHKMDETQIGSIEVAIQKARSAISFKRPTKAFEDAVAGGRIAILSLPGAIPIEGGLPIMVDGKIIGAIGASGGSSAQDGQAAKVGLDALAKSLGK